MMTAIGILCLLALTSACVLGNILLWTQIRGKFHKMRVEREELAIERLRAECELKQLERSARHTAAGEAGVAGVA